MSKYFKIVGGLGLVLFVILIIWDIAEISNLNQFISDYPEVKEELSTTLFMAYSSLVLYIFTGPAVSLMLISYGNKLEE